MLSFNTVVVLFFHLNLFSCWSTERGTLVRDKRQRSYAITNLSMNRALNKLDSKLARHEYREAQLADFTMNTLNALTAGQEATKKDIRIVSQQLAQMEEKMFSIQALISTTDERQRHMMKGLSEGLNRLIAVSRSNDLPPMPELARNSDFPSNGEDSKKLMNKMEALKDTIENDINKLNTNVKEHSKAINLRMDQLNSVIDDRLVSVQCNRTLLEPLTSMVGELSNTSKLFIEELTVIKNNYKNSESLDGCNAAVMEIAQKFDSLDAFQRQKTEEMTIVEMETQKAISSQKRELQKLVEVNEAEHRLVEDSMQNIVQNLQRFQTLSQEQLGMLEANIGNVLRASSDKINTGINTIASTLKLKTTNIMDALDDSSSQNRNIQDIMRDSFVDLTGEIKGLKKVEQVMISTADAVLDTKRSIEFGIQQVIIELSELVRKNGQTINSTLTNKINDISFAILQNQTNALANMTSKMEHEISQVWRQIGVMYNEILQSVTILDDLQSTTSQQMNQSLGKVDHIDGTVDKINGKVAGVEDDLNYLLGRLTLVVSEFAQLKTGVGSELDRLRDMAKEFSSNDLVEYKLQDDKPTE